MVTPESGDSSFLLPTLGDGPLLPYRLIHPPVGIGKLAAGRPGSASERDLQPYLAWVEQGWRQRSAYASFIFTKAGFSASEVPPQSVVDLEDWLYQWLPRVFEPYTERGWTTNLTPDGSATVLPSGYPGYNPIVEQLTLSLTHDLAFVIIAALPHETNLKWTVYAEKVEQPEGLSTRLYPTIEGSKGEPVGEAYSMILGALSRPESASATVLKRRREAGWHRLGDLYKILQKADG